MSASVRLNEESNADAIARVANNNHRETYAVRNKLRFVRSAAVRVVQSSILFLLSGLGAVSPLVSSAGELHEGANGPYDYGGYYRNVYGPIPAIASGQLDRTGHVSGSRSIDTPCRSAFVNPYSPSYYPGRHGVYIGAGRHSYLQGLFSDAAYDYRILNAPVPGLRHGFGR